MQQWQTPDKILNLCPSLPPVPLQLPVWFCRHPGLGGSCIPQSWDCSVTEIVIGDSSDQEMQEDPCQMLIPCLLCISKDMQTAGSLQAQAVAPPWIPGNIHGCRTPDRWRWIWAGNLYPHRRVFPWLIAQMHRVQSGQQFTDGGSWVAAARGSCCWQLTIEILGF